MDDPKRPKQFAVSNNISKKKAKDYISEAIIIGAIIIAVALLANMSNFQINGSYLVGASPNATVQTNITNELLETIIKDELGNGLRVSAYSEAFVCSRQDDVAVQFQYNIPDYVVNSESIDTGTVIQNQSQALLSTGTGLNAAIDIESIEAIRYRPGHEAMALYTAAFLNGGVENVEQLTGAFNENEDGYVIGFNGTTKIVGRIKGGINYWVPQSEWDDPINGSGVSKCNVDFTKLHQWRISYGWLGIAQINYEVQCGEGQRWVPFHTLDLTNVVTTPTINNPVLPIHMHIHKNGSAENVQIRTSSWSGGICNGGAIEAGKRHFVAHKSQTLPANTLTSLITLRSNQTLFGKTNRIDSILEYLSVGTDGNKNVEIYLLRNADTGLTFNDPININNSAIYVNYTTAVVTGGTLENVFAVAKVGQLNTFLEELFIDFHKNETITVAGFSTGASEVVSTLRWEELY